MKWKKLLRDAKELDGRISQDLGTLKVGFGYIGGEPFLEIKPLASRFAPEKEPSNILLIKIGRVDNIIDVITDLVNNTLEIDEKNLIREKKLEKLLQIRKKKANAIMDLEIS